MTLPDDRLNLPAAGPLQGMPDNLHPVSINPLLPDNVAAATLRASKAVEQANIEYNKGHIRQAHTLYSKTLRMFERAPVHNYDIDRTIFSIADIEFRFGDFENGRRALARFLNVARPSLDDTQIDALVASRRYSAVFQRLLQLSRTRLEGSASAGGPTADADKWEIVGLERGSSGEIISALQAFQNSYACAPALGRSAWLGNIGIVYLAMGRRESGTTYLLSAPMTDMFLEAAATQWAGIVLAAWAPRR